jgi:hypothetical protein
MRPWFLTNIYQIQYASTYSTFASWLPLLPASPFCLRKGKTSLPALAQSRIAWGLRPHPPPRLHQGRECGLAGGRGGVALLADRTYVNIEGLQAFTTPPIKYGLHCTFWRRNPRLSAELMMILQSSLSQGWLIRPQVWLGMQFRAFGGFKAPTWFQIRSCVGVKGVGGT